MGPGLVATNVGKVQIQRNEKPAFVADSLPDSRIFPAGEALVANPIGLICGVPQQLYVQTSQVLVELQKYTGLE